MKNFKHAAGAGALDFGEEILPGAGRDGPELASLDRDQDIGKLVGSGRDVAGIPGYLAVEDGRLAEPPPTPAVAEGIVSVDLRYAGWLVLQALLAGMR